MKALYLLLVAAIAAAGTTSAFAAGTLYVDSKTVQKAQKTLNDRGYRTGGVDGKMGPQTQTAIVNFQRAEKLQPTLSKSNRWWTAMQSMPAAPCTCPGKNKMRE